MAPARPVNTADWIEPDEQVITALRLRGMIEQPAGRDGRVHPAGEPFTTADALLQLSGQPAMREILLGADLSRFNKRYLDRYSQPPRSNWAPQQAGRYDPKQGCWLSRYAATVTSTTIESHLIGRAAAAVYGWGLTTWACIDLDYGHDVTADRPAVHRRFLRAVRILRALFPGAWMEARYSHLDQPIWLSRSKHLPVRPTMGRATLHRTADGRMVHWSPASPHHRIHGVHVWLRWGGWLPRTPMVAHLATILQRYGIVQPTGKQVEIYPSDRQCVALPLRIELRHLPVGNDGARLASLAYEPVDADLLPLVPAWHGSAENPRPINARTYRERCIDHLGQHWGVDRLPGAKPPYRTLEGLDIQLEQPPPWGFRQRQLVPRPRYADDGDQVALEGWSPAGLPDLDVDDRPVPAVELDLPAWGDRRTPEERLRTIPVQQGVGNVPSPPMPAPMPIPALEPIRQAMVAADELAAGRPGEDGPPEGGPHQVEVEELSDDLLQRIADRIGPILAGQSNEQRLRIVREVERHHGSQEDAEAVLRLCLDGSTSTTPEEELLALLKGAWRESRARMGRFWSPGGSKALNTIELERLRALVAGASYLTDHPKAKQDGWIDCTRAIIQACRLKPSLAGEYVLSGTWMKTNLPRPPVRAEFRKWLLSIGCLKITRSNAFVGIAERYDLNALMVAVIAGWKLQRSKKYKYLQERAALQSLQSRRRPALR